MAIYMLYIRSVYIYIYILAYVCLSLCMHGHCIYGSKYFHLFYIHGDYKGHSWHSDCVWMLEFLQEPQDEVTENLSNGIKVLAIKMDVGVKPWIFDITYTRVASDNLWQPRPKWTTRRRQRRSWAKRSILFSQGRSVSSQVKRICQD